MTRRGQGILVALAVIMGVALVAGGVVVLARSSAPAQGPANVIKGDNKPNRLIGTDQPDKVFGYGASDRVRGRRGDDVLKGGSGGDEIGGGKGFDRIVGGHGNDRINARDGHPDEIACGAGRKDFAKVDRHEDGVFDCETVRSPRGPN
jgi:Ca2+-binding RTX toxin-like protein